MLFNHTDRAADASPVSLSAGRTRVVSVQQLGDRLAPIGVGVFPHRVQSLWCVFAVKQNGIVIPPFICNSPVGYSVSLQTANIKMRPVHPALCETNVYERNLAKGEQLQVATGSLIARR